MRSASRSPAHLVPRNPPPLDCVDAALHEQNLPPAPLSPPPASARIALSRAMRAGGDGPHGISPALKLRLQRTSSYRRRHPSSCIRALSIPAHGLFSAVTVPFTHIAHSMRRSVYYPLAFSVVPLVASLHSYVICGCCTTPMGPPPPLDDSAWVETPLALVGDIVAYKHIPGENFPLPSGMRPSPPAPTRSRNLLLGI